MLAPPREEGVEGDEEEEQELTVPTLLTSASMDLFLRPHSHLTRRFTGRATVRGGELCRHLRRLCEGR
jgi:hypothetical protein